MSRVIKNNSSMQATPIGRAGALNVANFSEQAKKLILDAQAKSSQILAQATTKAKEVEKLAEQRGYDTGFARGLADGQADGAEKAFAEAIKRFDQQTAELQKMLKQSVLKLEEARNDILQQARAELLDLALAIAEKVTHLRAEGDIAVAQASLSKAIDMVSCSGQVQAKVCPAQLNELREYAGQFLSEMGMSELVTLVGDESLAPGDVVLVSRQGEVDARVQTQLDNIVAALTGGTSEPQADEAANR
jgi:flagellar assembly protein FliH